MAGNRKRVLIATAWYDHRLHKGMEKYALQHHWHLTANLTRGRVIPWGWEGDGILAWLAAGDELADFVVQTRKPTVDFSLRRPELPFPRVLEDHAHAAGLVADHFLARGFNHFMFYSDAEIWAYEERGNGFVLALKRSGHDCVWIRWNRSPEYTDKEQWRRHQNWLAAELKRATKPLALFAANDDHAVDALEACESAGLAVPEEVAIVGADNYLLSPDAMQTPLSSVDTNLEELGYRGAALLDELMKGLKPPPAPIRVPAAGVVVRKSSDLVAVSHPGVAKSLRFMLAHFHEPISLEDLVGAAAMSRRGLHQAFLQHLKRTPGQELQRLRVGRAKELLARTSIKMEQLAESCGYQTANGFYLAFKQSTGLSPKEFRETANPAAENASNPSGTAARSGPTQPRGGR